MSPGVTIVGIKSIKAETRINSPYADRQFAIRSKPYYAEKTKGVVLITITR